MLLLSSQLLRLLSLKLRLKTTLTALLAHTEARHAIHILPTATATSHLTEEATATEATLLAMDMATAQATDTLLTVMVTVVMVETTRSMDTRLPRATAATSNLAMMDMADPLTVATTEVTRIATPKDSLRTADMVMVAVARVAMLKDKAQAILLATTAARVATATADTATADTDTDTADMATADTDTVDMATVDMATEPATALRSTLTTAPQQDGLLTSTAILPLSTEATLEMAGTEDPLSLLLLCPPTPTTLPTDKPLEEEKEESEEKFVIASTFALSGAGC